MNSFTLHRISRYFVVLLVSLLTVIAASCDKSTPVTSDPVDPIQEQLAQTPRANPEAETMAMVIARTFTAPQSLYERIDADLKAIRAKYADSIPAARVTFYGEWTPSRAHVYIDRNRVNDSASPKWQQFDSLLKYYRMTDSFQYEPYRDPSILSISLGFKGILNSNHLANILGELSIVRNVSRGGTVDHSDIYAIRDGDNMRYFFRLAFGDCLSGCIESEFSYFVSNKGGITYVGTYVASSGIDDPRAPRWVDTAWIAKFKTQY